MPSYRMRMPLLMPLAMRLALALLALAAGLAFALLATPALAAGGGIVQGKIVNGTAGGGSVEGVEVTLTAYFGETERNKLTTKSDATGSFAFTDLDTNSSYSYEATTNYQKSDYSASRVSFAGADGSKQVTLTVYDSTTDSKTVRATAKHYLLSFSNGEVQVSEILVLRNDTDRSYIGEKEVGPDQRATSHYMAPSQAKMVEYGDGLMSCCVVKDGAGFVDTMAITPGEVQKIFSYRIPYSGTSAIFNSALQQDVERVQVLVPSGGVRASITGLANHGSQTLQGATYQVFGADGLKANANLEINLEGLPVASPIGEGPLVLIAIALGALGAFAMAFYMLRKRSQQVPLPAYALPYAYPHGRVSPPASARTMSKKERRQVLHNPALIDLERRDLFAALANLDDSFESGLIDRRSYERLRAEKKQRLIELM